MSHAKKLGRDINIRIRVSPDAQGAARASDGIARIGRESLRNRLDELIGKDVFCGDDGFHMWFPTPDKGGWPSWALRVIADWMDDRDAEHAAGIEEYFERERGVEDGGTDGEATEIR